MATTAENNKRIAKNTLLLYVRMLLLMGITLYTSRVVLSVLGVTDFGIFNVVGGVVAMFGFLNNSMSIAVQRFLSFEIGRDNKQELNRLFNISLLVHIFIALLVLFIAETIGLWFVKTQMNFPADRLNAAIGVYHCIVASCMFTITQVPYNAMILAKEKMDAYAYISIVEVILRLGIVYILTIGSIDKLNLYGILTMAVTIITTFLYRTYTISKFPEAKFKIIWDTSTFKRITGFAGWSMCGEVAWMFTIQGVNILLNIFFGPIVNASRGISEQVNAAITRFISNFQVAVNPQLIKQYASNNLDEMKKLLFQSTKFSFYLSLLLSMPFFFDMDLVLKIWLKEVPDYAVIFCRLTLLASLTNSLSNLLATVARAYGKIQKYQLVVSFILLLNFPLSYLVLKMGAPPEATILVYIGISIVLILVRLFLTKIMIELSIKSYIKNVVLPCIKVLVIASILPSVCHFFLDSSVMRFLISGVLSVLSVCCSIYIWGITADERYLIASIINKRFHFKME